MSHYLPKGREKRFCAMLNEAAEDLDENAGFDVHKPHSLNITALHAVEGVRTNGHEQVVSALDSFRALREYLGEMVATRRALVRQEKRAGKAFERAEAEMRAFRICPVCHGHKGSQTERTNSRSGYWTDCDHCEGRGIVEKEAS